LTKTLDPIALDPTLLHNIGSIGNSGMTWAICELAILELAILELAVLEWDIPELAILELAILELTIP
jgi:hypothetical protein